MVPQKAVTYADVVVCVALCQQKSLMRSRIGPEMAQEIGDPINWLLIIKKVTS
jgi:hypothetical protein